MNQILLFRYFREKPEQRRWRKGLSWEGPAGSCLVSALSLPACVSLDVMLYAMHAITTFPGGSVVNNPLSMQETQQSQVQSLGGEDPLEEEIATHSSILA